jgi:predicted secreted protein
MVVAHVGDIATIDLPATPSTGYQWSLPTVPDGVELVGTDFTPPAGTTIGAAGVQHFRVRADRVGTFELGFVLSRPWEGSVEDSVTVRLESS